MANILDSTEIILSRTTFSFTPEAYQQAIQKILDSEGAILEIKPPNHKEFVTLESRLKTFDKCKKQMKQDIQTLCEAGFYYTEDQVYCFCCCQILPDCEDDDELWTAHAKLSPNCTYVLLSKGKYFVDEACGLSRGKSNIEDVNQKLSIFGNRAIAVSDCDVAECIVEHMIMPVIFSTSTETPGLLRSEIPNSKLCRICWKEEIKIAFVPCGHAIACIQCAMAINKCAVCRYPLNKVVKLNIIYVNSEKEQDNQLPCNSSESPKESSDQLLCRFCDQEEMNIVFLPCRHVYGCEKCSLGITNCPVCQTGVLVAFKIYFN